MPPVRFVPNTDAPTHLGNFRDVVIADSAPRPGVPFLPDELGAASRISVEASWDADLANPETWHWTDITGDVRFAEKIQIKVGRADEGTQAEYAECHFTLDNSSGDYTPRLATGAYYPYVERGVPIRVRINTGTGDHVRFLGYATEYTPDWDESANLATMSIISAGVLRRLAQGASPLDSPMRRSIVAAGPKFYWPFEDESGASQIASGLSGGAALVPIGTITYANNTDLPGAKQAITLGADTDISFSGSTSFGGKWQVDWFTKLPSGGFATETILIRIFTTGTVVLWDFVVGPGYQAVHGYSGSGVLLADSGHFGLSSWFLGQWIHLRMMAKDAGGGNVQAAFVEFPISGAGGSIPITGYAGTPGDVVGFIIGIREGADLTDVSMSHLAIYDKFDFSATDQSARGYAPDEVLGIHQETATDRLARLCNEESMPINIENIEDFEDEDVKFGLNGTWTRTNAVAHRGQWSLRSAAIGSNSQTNVFFRVPTGATTMSFWYKVSSESGFDFFNVFFDNVYTGFQASGEVDWTQKTMNVTGVTEVAFQYAKDPAVIGGSDAAWIDDLSFSISSTVMGAQSIDTLLNLIRECEAADHGILYDGFGVGLGYVPRSSLYNENPSLTVDMTLSQVAPPFQPKFDDQRIVNKFTASRENGSSATFQDSTGPLGSNSIGVYDSSGTLNVDSDLVLADHAAWSVHLGTIEELRYPNLNLNLRASPELVPDWLNTRLLGRIDVTNVSSRLTQHPVGTVSLLVEGYSETITPIEWTVEANCSPYSPYQVGELTTFGYLDCGASTLATSIDSTQTSISVKVADSCFWTHSDGDYNILMGGEEMTVTAVGAASSPQTLTVTRSVNGVVKSHGAGEEVHVADPFILAL